MFGVIRTMRRCRDDAAFKPRDNCRNVVESSAAVTLHVVSEQMVMYYMTSENVLDALRVLNKHVQNKY